MTDKDITLPSVDGMPPLQLSRNIVSSFEFWPLWVMYMPVVFLWVWLSVRYRSLSLPLIANPKIFLSGMIGFSKSSVLASANENSQQWILPWIRYEIQNDVADIKMTEIEAEMQAAGLEYPVVAKPDLGCRGAGVCLIHEQRGLMDYIKHYPKGSSFMLQKLSSWEPEAGVFYIRYPNESRGKIISLALKYSPYVVGDGKRTLQELIDADPRASQVKHLYETRHEDNLSEVLPAGEEYKLVFSASHCRGAVFKDGNEYITEELTERLDEIMSGLPELYYGRLDIKFRDIQSLTAGETLEIIEINGASSESLHIWDSNANLKDAWSTLLTQFKILFQIGKQNRDRGYRPPGLYAMYQAWKRESHLVQYYPDTH